jgi:hypothetical protein
MEKRDTSPSWFNWQESYFGPPASQPSADLTSTSTPAHLLVDKAARDSLEDKIRQTIDGWTEIEQATAYWYLYASGMNLERAKSIRRKARFVS